MLMGHTCTMTLLLRTKVEHNVITCLNGNDYSFTNNCYYNFLVATFYWTQDRRVPVAPDGFKLGTSGTTV